MADFITAETRDGLTRAVYGMHIDNLIALRSGAEPHSCALPADCSECERYQCMRCESVVPWELGAADDTPGLCDDCALWFAGVPRG